VNCKMGELAVVLQLLVVTFVSVRQKQLLIRNWTPVTKHMAIYVGCKGQKAYLHFPSYHNLAHSCLAGTDNLVSNTIWSLNFFNFSGWGQTESTWCVGHHWPIVAAPDDVCWWVWSSRWNENWQGKPNLSENTCQSTALSTTNATWPDSSRCDGKPATNRLSYGTAYTNCTASYTDRLLTGITLSSSTGIRLTDASYRASQT
jgi:hypothetical protein